MSAWPHQHGIKPHEAWNSSATSLFYKTSSLDAEDDTEDCIKPSTKVKLMHKYNYMWPNQQNINNLWDIQVTMHG